MGALISNNDSRYSSVFGRFTFETITFIYDAMPGSLVDSSTHIIIWVFDYIKFIRKTTESGTSMVILIGGVGCTGKTLLAGQLMKELGIPYFPLDHLMMGIVRGMPDCGFTPDDDQFILGEKMWPVIKGMIMTNIENDHSIILEGFQLLPHLVRDFPPAYLENILPLYLLLSEGYIKEHSDAKIMRYRSAVERRDDIDDISVESLIRDNKRLKEQCVKNGVAFFEIEDDYEAGMKEARDYIMAKYG